MTLVTPDPPFLDVSFLVPDAERALVESTERYGTGIRSGFETWFPAPGVLGVAEGEAVVHRGGVVSFRTSGEAFSAPDPSEMTAAFPVGAAARACLFERLTALDAPYAGIVLLHWMGTPEECARGENVHGFTDFALSAAWFSARVLARVEQLYASAFTERTDELLYVSTSEWFNPAERWIDASDALRRSERVAEIVGGALGRGVVS